NQKRAGVISDIIIRMGADESKAEKVVCRRIRFKSPQTNKTFSFITNDLTSKASHIAATYKKRWSIELLFKRLKQNMPLKYFLGDNQNAIKIQIWCALITDLLFQVIKRQVKRGWAFSNLVKLVRLHLFNYLNRTVIFVHGCFWHGHRNCKYYKLPRTNTTFWKMKVDTNRSRDRRKSRLLRNAGWTVITIWQCQLKKSRYMDKLGRLLASDS